MVLAVFVLPISQSVLADTITATVTVGKTPVGIAYDSANGRM